MPFRKLKRKIAIKLGVAIYKLNTVIAKETLPEFGNKQDNLVIEMPRRIFNSKNIYIGNNVSIGPNCLLTAIEEYPPKNWRDQERKSAIQKFNPRIAIGNGVSSTSNLTIGALEEVVIEDDVMFASNVMITDGLHGFETVNEPYKYQPMCRIAPVIIKKGCWIGQNVVIMPGVTIGEYSIIGANSVVTKDVPDQCIAMGSPAKISKTWDATNNKWNLISE